MRLAFVSGSRADRGPLQAVFDRLAQEHAVHWVTVGAEIAPAYPADVVYTVIQTMHQVRISLADHPADAVVLLGDRHEVLGAALAACILGVPVIHLSGGDVTGGSQDECFRHAITKLSHVHFPTCPESAERILRMGEEPWRVHMVGSPSVDRVLSTDFLPRDAALRVCGLDDGDFLLVCMHPSTTGETEAELVQLDKVLEKLGSGKKLVAVGPNADVGSRRVREFLLSLCADRGPGAVYCEHLGRVTFLSLMKHCVAMVGNSSSMYYEAPALSTPVVIIGSRQDGRSVVVDDGKACERIAGVVADLQLGPQLLRKRFCDE